MTFLQHNLRNKKAPVFWSAYSATTVSGATLTKFVKASKEVRVFSELCWILIFVPAPFFNVIAQLKKKNVGMYCFSSAL